jgi:hypothetical protein
MAHLDRDALCACMWLFVQSETGDAGALNVRWVGLSKQIEAFDVRLQFEWGTLPAIAKSRSSTVRCIFACTNMPS